MDAATQKPSISSTVATLLVSSSGLHVSISHQLFYSVGGKPFKVSNLAAWRRTLESGPYALFAGSAKSPTRIDNA